LALPGGHGQNSMLKSRVQPTTTPRARSTVANGSARPASCSASAPSMYAAVSAAVPGTTVKP